MDILLRTLLDALDAVGEDHEEIYDTVCREKMGDSIVYLFIKPDADYVAPDEFGLYDTAANLAVRQALVTYATAANSMAKGNPSSLAQISAIAGAVSLVN